MTRTLGVRAISIAAALLAVSPAFSQKGGATGTGSTGSGTTGTGTTGTGTTGTGAPGTGTTGIGRTPGTTTPGTTQPTTTPTIQQPIFLSGRVMLEDGTPPPESVVIQTVCNGIPKSEGYTDSKGYFSLELGANRGVIQDASEYSSSGSTMGGLTGSSSPMGSMGGGMGGDRKYMGCDLQGKLAGFRSQTVSLSGRRPMDDPNIGTIQEEGITVSMVSLAAPKDAKKAYDKGMDALKKKKYEDAQTNFEKAVEIYPRYAVAWYELGRLRTSQDQFDIARGSFAEAIKADPKFVLPYVSLSYLELQAKRWQQLAEVTEKTIKLDPFDYPQSYFFNSVAHFNMRDLEAAEKSGLQAERLDTRNQFPQVHHLLGMILADRKDWDGAAARFKNYLKLSPKAENADAVRSQLSQVERIKQQLATAKEQ